MYEKEQEKQKALSLIQQSSEMQDELSSLSKEQRRKRNFKKSIEFALEEIDEFEKEFNRFVEKVDHLVIFQESIKKSMTNDVKRISENIRTLVTKNYTEEERNRMSEELLFRVKHSQKVRRELLTKVAMKYIKSNKPKNN